jgi:hypothetical protein
MSGGARLRTRPESLVSATPDSSLPGKDRLRPICVQYPRELHSPAAGFSEHSTKTEGNVNGGQPLFFTVLEESTKYFQASSDETKLQCACLAGEWRLFHWQTSCTICSSEFSLVGLHYNAIDTWIPECYAEQHHSSSVGIGSALVHRCVHHGATGMKCCREWALGKKDTMKQGVTCYAVTVRVSESATITLSPFTVQLWKFQNNL